MRMFVEMGAFTFARCSSGHKRQVHVNDHLIFGPFAATSCPTRNLYEQGRARLILKHAIPASRHASGQ